LSAPKTVTDQRASRSLKEQALTLRLTVVQGGQSGIGRTNKTMGREIRSLGSEWWCSVVTPGVKRGGELAGHGLRAMSQRQKLDSNADRTVHNLVKMEKGHAVMHYGPSRSVLGRENVRGSA